MDILENNLFFIKEAIDDTLETELLRQFDENSPSWRNMGTRSIQTLNWKPSKMAMEESDTPKISPCVAKVLAMLQGYDGIGSDCHPPNNILINRYLPGGGIAPHCDGALNAKRVAIVTLGSGALMTFHRREGADIPAAVGGSGFTAADSSTAERMASIYLPPRSLMIFCGELYDHYHCIPTAVSDVIESDCRNASELGLQLGQDIPRGPQARISLTIRHFL